MDNVTRCQTVGSRTIVQFAHKCSKTLRQLWKSTIIVVFTQYWSNLANVCASLKPESDIFSLANAYCQRRWKSKGRTSTLVDTRVRHVAKICKLSIPKPQQEARIPFVSSIREGEICRWTRLIVRLPKTRDVTLLLNIFPSLLRIGRLGCITCYCASLLQSYYLLVRAKRLP